jgi:hypothetical protein
MRSSRCFNPCLLIVAGLSLPAPVLAAGFAAGISPSKFELRAEPGDIVRDTVTIMNPADEPADYELRTADWHLNETSGIEYVEDGLAEGSCRPWVRLERRTIQVRAREQRTYRFEVHVPADAAPGLCRFAIFIEPAEAMRAELGDSGVSFPIVGRFAVITYVTIGDARAEIEYLGMGATLVNEQTLPTLKLRNTGTTFDRAFGQVMATDAENQRVALIPSNFPVLPGRTEEILLSPATDPDRKNPVRLVYPLALSGRIEIGGETLRIEGTFEPGAVTR